MSVWMQWWKCSGWVFCLHSFGDTYQTICCDLFVMENVEGKDCPQEFGTKKCDEIGKTAGLLLHIFSSFFELPVMLFLTLLFGFLRL